MIKFGTAARHVAFVAAALGVLASSANADGEYFGLDVSQKTKGAVFSSTRGDFTFGTTVTDYDDGVSAGLSLTRRLPWDLGIEGLTLSAGPALGLGGGDLSELSLGVAASAQRYKGTNWGSYFLQASLGSTNRSFFVQAQTTFAEPGITLGLSRGGSTEYNEASLSISKRLGDSPVSLRGGYLLMGKRAFVGFSINTF